MNKATILYINNFAGPGIGGGEQHLLLLVNAARREGYDVVIACLPESDVSQWLESKGFKVVGFNPGHPNIPRTIAQLREIVTTQRASIVHAHGFLPGLITRLSLRVPHRLSRRPAVVTTIHCQPNSTVAFKSGSIAKVLQKFRTKADRSTAKWGDVFIAVSEDIKKQLVNIGFPKNRIVLIHNGIDVDEARRLADQELQVGLSKASRNIGIVARLEAVKDISSLLKAVKLLPDGYGNTRLNVVGDGKLKGQLEKEARMLGVEERVKFLGYLKNPLPLVKEIDVYVLSSLSEGLNVTLLEAMTLGRPIVATAVGGNRELIINKKTGLSVPPADPPALASAIAELLDNPVLASRLGDASKRLVEDEFSAHMMCRKVLDIYKQLKDPS